MQGGVSLKMHTQATGKAMQLLCHYPYKTVPATGHCCCNTHEPNHFGGGAPLRTRIETLHTVLRSNGLRQIRCPYAGCSTIIIRHKNSTHVRPLGAPSPLWMCAAISVPKMLLIFCLCALHGKRCSARLQQCGPSCPEEQCRHTRKAQAVQHLNRGMLQLMGHGATIL